MEKADICLGPRSDDVAAGCRLAADRVVMRRRKRRRGHNVCVGTAANAVEAVAAVVAVVVDIWQHGHARGLQDGEGGCNGSRDE